MKHEEMIRELHKTRSNAMLLPYPNTKEINALQQAIEMLERGRWRNPSEELPEEVGGYYLVKTEGHKDYSYGMEVASYTEYQDEEDDWKVKASFDNDWGDVVAWRPLPQYEEVSE